MQIWYSDLDASALWLMILAVAMTPLAECVTVVEEPMDANDVVEAELTIVEPDSWLARKLLIVETPP